MIRFLLLTVAIVTFQSALKAQYTDVLRKSEEVHLLNRLETFSGAFSNSLFLDNPYVNRKDLYDYLSVAKTNVFSTAYSNIDQFNINRALSLSGECDPLHDDAANSKHPILNTFYTTETDFYRLKRSNFFLSVNPVLGFNAVLENKGQPDVLFNTSAGIELRGSIKNRLGLYFFVTHNYEEPVNYQRTWFRQWEAIPGAGRFSTLPNGYEYLKIRGYADLALIKNHISFTAGYDQHFIGDGIRSLFLSDFSEGALFAALNTKIWKINYRNIYLRLEPQAFAGMENVRHDKYAAIHHLSINIRPWLNIGLFESVTFTRNGHFEIGYMNPIIFYRALERSMGSPDKVSVGVDAKAIVLKRVNLYGQFLLNEFTAKEFFASNGYWANKWGTQFGIKYFNAFTIKNLDIQAEMNLVRPYTYTHSDKRKSIANFTHFNQPLAHPLGAGFAEIAGIVRYQPIPRLHTTARVMYYKQGVDTGASNYGNNIFKSYTTRSNHFGVGLISGPEVNCMLANLSLSYELRPRLYFDIGATYRNHQSKWVPDQQEDVFFNAGVRLNLNSSYRYF